MINKNMHFIWVGSKLPDNYAENVSRWRQMHSSWNVFVWQEEDLQWLLNQDLFDNAEKYVNPSLVGQLRSDIARYEILHDHGGFYADVDTYPLQPIDDVLEGREEMAAWEDRNWIGNTYLYAREKANPIFCDIIDEMRASIEAGARRSYRPNRMTGPRFITPIWKQNEGFVAPQEWFYPYSYQNLKRGTVPTEFGPEVVAIHQWANTRRILERKRR